MKNILITGGTEGLGRGIAEVFAAQKNWRVCILGKNAYKAATIAEELQVEHVVADVTSAESIQNSAEVVQKHMGQLAVLVNNAGVHIKGSFEDMDANAIEQMVNVNLLGPMLVTQAYLPLLDKDSRIFNIGSFAGREPAEGAPVYAAAKAGLGAFNQAISKDLRRRGISSILVTIGALDTDTQNSEGSKAHQKGGLKAVEVAESLLFYANGPRNVSPEEIALHGADRWLGSSPLTTRHTTKQSA